jgi:hypothetical protein
MVDDVHALGALNQPQLDFLILADRAEAVNGKLYLMGGAWDRYYVQDFKQPVPFSLAIGVRVPWNATNQRYDLQISVENLDSQGPPPLNLQVQLVTGRPPELPVGDSQMVVLAIPAVGVIFPGPSTYQAVAALSTGDRRTALFRLIAAPAGGVPQPPT